MYYQKEYQDYLTARSKRAMREKAERGIFPGCAPLGYRNAEVNGEKVIVVDEKTAPLVREAFSLASTGRYSLRKILKKMTAKGMVSRNGHPMGVSGI